MTKLLSVHTLSPVLLTLCLSTLCLSALGCGKPPAPPADPHGEEGHEDGDKHEDGEHDEHREHSESVSLTAEARAAARLVVAPASARAWSGGFRTVARVRLDPRREARIGASGEGQIDRLRLQPGDRVEVGTVLAEIRSPALAEAVAAYHTRAAERDLSAARLARARELAAGGTASPAQLAEAQASDTAARAAYEAAEERLRVLGVRPDPSPDGHFPSRFPVRSPVAGELLASRVSVGQAVTTDIELFHVGNLDQVWVMLDVFERDLSRVSVGQSVRFTMDAWQGEVFTGAVAWIGSVVEEGSRTIEVRVVADNPDHRLKPGMFGRAELGQQTIRSAEGAANLEAAPEAIVVPAEAVQEIEGRAVVFVEEGERFEARPITVGQRSAAEVQILTGIKAGERVVVGGAFTLKSELAKAELGEGHAH